MHRPKLTFPLLYCLGGIVLVFLFHVGLGGSVRLSPSEILAELFRGPTGGESLANSILWDIRLPRSLAALLAGGVLGAIGTAFQSFFRNALAEPYVVGVSSGAGLFGTIALISGAGLAMNGLLVPLVATMGGMLSLGLVMLIGWSKGRLDVLRLLIGGIVVGQILSASMTVVLLASGEDTNQVLRWLMGSLTPMDFQQVVVLAIALVISIVMLGMTARQLNVIAVEHTLAERLGINVKKLSFWVLGLGAFAVSLVVGTVGIIGLVGLVAPHIARSWLGADNRRVWPIATSIGAMLLGLADLAAQRIIPSAELPVGAVTAIVGAPVLIWILRRPMMKLVA